jgi:hypothetical protein
MNLLIIKGLLQNTQVVVIRGGRMINTFKICRIEPALAESWLMTFHRRTES